MLHIAPNFHVSPLYPRLCLKLLPGSNLANAYQRLVGVASQSIEVMASGQYATALSGTRHLLV